MTAYYCDVDADFVAGRDGTDGTTEVLTGPGGLQIAIRGGGGAAGEFKAGGLVAGDILYVKGTTGLVSRLVKVLIATNGNTPNAWEIGDVVRDNTAGTHWTGKVVQERDNVATGLSGNQQVLIQLDAPYDYDDINDNFGDGIENTTKAETGTIVQAADVTCVGIEFDTNEGTEAAGYLKIVGVNSSWVNDGTYAVLDGDGDADHCIDRVDVDYWWFENLEQKNSTGNLMERTSGYLYNHVRLNCYFHDTSGNGINDVQNGHNSNMILCKFASCGIGIYNPKVQHIYACKFLDNTTGLWFSDVMGSVAGNVFHGNGTGIRSGAYLGTVAVLNNVFDGNTTVGLDHVSYALLALGNRFTNHSGAGDFGFRAGANVHGILGWNYFQANDTNYTANGPILLSVNGAATNAEDQGDADCGYVDSAGHDFNLAAGATLRSVAVELD